MPTDLFSQVLFNNGEGAVHTDFNRVGSRAAASALDQILLRQVGNLGVSADPDIVGVTTIPGHDSLIYTSTGGDCVIQQGAAATQVKLGTGTLFQRRPSPAAVDGTEALFLPYTIVESDSTQFTISAGHATLPRIDIVQVKLEWIDGATESRDIEDATTRIVTSTTVSKTRQVQATFSVKAGTAAATPSYPAPDTGYGIVASIRVPSTWTTGTTPDGTGSTTLLGLRQCTMPIGVSMHCVTPLENAANGTNWTVTSAVGWIASGGAGSALVVWCPTGSSTKRIVGISVTGRWNTTGSLTLRRCDMTLFGPNVGGSSYVDLSPVLVNTDNTFRTYFAHVGHIADASTDSNPSGANGVVGDPFWAAGGKAGPAAKPIGLATLPVAGDIINRTGIVMDAGINSGIYQVVFWLAG